MGGWWWWWGRGGGLVGLAVGWAVVGERKGRKEWQRGGNNETHY